MSDDILAAIDAAIGCQLCGAPLDESPSLDFCSEDHQEHWHQLHVDPLEDDGHPVWGVFPDEVSHYARARLAAEQETRDRIVDTFYADALRCMTIAHLRPDEARLYAESMRLARAFDPADFLGPWREQAAPRIQRDHTVTVVRPGHDDVDYRVEAVGANGDAGYSARGGHAESRATFLERSGHHGMLRATRPATPRPTPTRHHPVVGGAPVKPVEGTPYPTPGPKGRRADAGHHQQDRPATRQTGPAGRPAPARG